MIVYVTGAPGSGKTLWTIQRVRKMRDAEPSRPVFYRFPEKTPDVADSLGWTRLKDGDDVHALPATAIIILDEAWEYYPQRKASTPVPKSVEAYATHRHRGHDFFILTQRVTSVDHFIRGLVGQHVHFERQFGLDRSRRYEWQKMGDPANKFSRDESTSSEFRFPKEVYALYRSAEVHVVKKQLPVKRLAAIVVGILLVPVLVYFALRVTLAAPDSGDVSDVAIPGVPVAARSDGQISAAEYAAQFVERVEGLPYSAPFYDGTVSAVTFPKISGCMLIEFPRSARCSCNTQQGTRITSISEAQCRHYVANGWFDFSKPDEEEASGRAVPPVYAGEPTQLTQTTSSVPATAF